MTDLEGLLAAMAKQMDKAWILGITDTDGMLIASWQSSDNKLNPEIIAANTLKVVRILNSVFSEGGQEIAAGGGLLTGLEDIILATSFSYIIVRPTSKGACYLVIDASKEVPLGIIRMTATNFIPKLEKALPGA